MARRQWSAGSWPSARPGMQPRVLVESSDAVEQWAMEEALRDAGYEVAVCDGPTVYGSPCPLAQGGGCALAAGADAVVNGFALGVPENRDVIRALQECCPATPVIVEARRHEVDRYADLLDGCQIMPFWVNTAGLLSAVREVLP